MSQSNRPLILRSNRFLGSALLERELISNETLETANEKLLELIQAGDLRNASLLNVLMFDMKALDESALVESIIDSDSVGVIELDNYNLRNVYNIDLDLDLCLATYTLPFDRVEDVTMVATAYYLSKPTIAHWKEQFDTNIIWYLSSVTSLVNAIERFRQHQSSEAAPAET